MSTSNNCYVYEAGNVVLEDVLSPCGVTNSTNPNVPCCWKGDTCLSDGICTYTHSLNGGSGYVAAGCTDSQFGEGCRSLCTNNAFGDIVYVDSEQGWHCCSYPPGGPLNCSNPSSERFLAPAPTDLATIQDLPKTGTPSYVTGAASSTAVASASNTATSPNQTAASSGSATPSSASSSSSHGLSSGAAAGIGVGVGLGSLALVGLVGFFVYRHRRNKRRDVNAPHVAGPESPVTMLSYEHRQPLSELQAPPKNTAPVELGTARDK